MLATEGARAESVAGLTVGAAGSGPWPWENVSGFWAIGWCNLSYVPGHTAKP